jgi:hypothetical protein
VEDQHDAGLAARRGDGVSEVGLEDRLVGDVLGGQQVVDGVELMGIGELLGEGAAGMADERVGDADQSLGAARVAEASGAEVGVAEAGVEAGGPPIGRLLMAEVVGRFEVASRL